MSAQHRLDLFEPGTLRGAIVVCLGSPSDECQQWCAEGCEEFCTNFPERRPAGPGFPEGMVLVVGHRWEPIGSCRIADWINAVGVEDTCADDDFLVFDEDGETQPLLHSGLIETEWTGDDYVWSYPLADRTEVAR